MSSCKRSYCYKENRNNITKKYFRFLTFLDIILQFLSFNEKGSRIDQLEHILQITDDKKKTSIDVGLSI